MNKCPYCSCFHEGTCTRVKAIEYHPDGTVKRVEFYTPMDYRPIEGLTFGPGNTPALPDVRKIQSMADALLSTDSTVQEGKPE